MTTSRVALAAVLLASVACHKATPESRPPSPVDSPAAAPTSGGRSVPSSDDPGRPPPHARPVPGAESGLPPGVDSPPGHMAGPSDLPPERSALYTALLPRDAGTACADLPLGADPVAELVWVVDNISAPPWVGIRSAECVITGHVPANAAVLDAWVVDPNRKGLGWLVLGQLDALPVDQALALATRALTDGPDPDAARRRIVRADNPEIAALAAQ